MADIAMPWLLNDDYTMDADGMLDSLNLWLPLIRRECESHINAIDIQMCVECVLKFS